MRESRYRMRFYLDPNSITMANNDYHNLLRGMQASGAGVTGQFRYQSGSYKFNLLVLDDLVGYRNTNIYSLRDEPHYIEIEWVSGAGNGYLSLWIDGVLRQTLSGL